MADLLPENNPVSPSYANQVAIFDPESFKWPVHIVGAGSIGSMALFALSALGIHSIHLWDADVLERHNTPTQPIYRTTSDWGIPKVEAAADFVKRQELGVELTLHPEFVDDKTPLSGIVISGVDTMKARKEIYAAVKANLVNIPLYFDGRIGGETMSLFTFLPTDRAFRKYYEMHWLFDDDAAAELPCGGRNIIGPPLALAALIAENLTLYHRSLPFERHVNFSMKSTRFDIFQI